MNRLTEDRLLRFCVEQCACFQPRDWASFPHPDATELAVTAYFLACVTWYGHRRDLVEIAERLAPGCAEHFTDWAAEKRFDFSRFSTMLRRRLRHAGSSVS